MQGQGRKKENDSEKKEKTDGPSDRVKYEIMVEEEERKLGIMI